MIFINWLKGLSKRQTALSDNEDKVDAYVKFKLEEDELKFDFNFTSISAFATLYNSVFNGFTDQLFRKISSNIISEESEVSAQNFIELTEKENEIDLLEEISDSDREVWWKPPEDLSKVLMDQDQDEEIDGADLLVGDQGMEEDKEMSIQNIVLNNEVITSMLEAWTGHTNFDITPYEKHIKDLRGVEFYMPISKYRFMVTVGKLFKFSEVRPSLNELLNIKNSVLKN